jgi:regulatory protein
VKITAIKAQVKSDNRVSVFLDDKYSFSLTLDQLLDSGIKKGDEVDENQAKQYKKLSDEGKLKQRTLEWVLGRPHSTREFRDYLYRKKAEKDLIAAWVDEFTEKKFLDDDRFARWFAENRRRKNKSSRAIRSELMSKGISSVTIQSVVAEMESEVKDQYADNKSEVEALQELVNKLRNRPRYQDVQKLKMHLISKGFRYDDIKTALLKAEEQD